MYYRAKVPFYLLNRLIYPYIEDLNYSLAISQGSKSASMLFCYLLGICHSFSLNPLLGCFEVIKIRILLVCVVMVVVGDFFPRILSSLSALESQTRMDLSSSPSVRRL